MEVYYPENLLLQWHITNRCNLRCAHCYQEDYRGKELNFHELLAILEQFRNMLTAPCTTGQPAIPGHITVTGGEPFIRQDFMDLLNYLALHRNEFSFAILTNGTMIDKVTAQHLKNLNPLFVQVSIDGIQKTHDRLRGPGNFEQTAISLRHLVTAGVTTFISFTAHRGNFHEFIEVARFGRSLKVSRVWADRLIPQGTGSKLHTLVLTPAETMEFFEIISKARSEIEHAWFCRTEIAMHRALQFLVGGGKPYHCTAGDTLITVQPNGDLYPCRRMPIRIGNVLETPLDKLYSKSELFRKLRRKDQFDVACQDCDYAALCRGGLKCLSYALTGDPFKADPGCRLVTE